MTPSMRTDVCDLLGIEHPIVAAPMGPDLTGPEFVAAVSNAGGLGILQAQLCLPPLFRQVMCLLGGGDLRGYILGSATQRQSRSTPSKCVGILRIALQRSVEVIQGRTCRRLLHV